MDGNGGQLLTRRHDTPASGICGTFGCELADNHGGLHQVAEGLAARPHRKRSRPSYLSHQAGVTLDDDDEDEDDKEEGDLGQDTTAHTAAHCQACRGRHVKHTCNKPKARVGRRPKKSPDNHLLPTAKAEPAPLPSAVAEPLHVRCVHVTWRRMYGAMCIG